jgi:hypothetical protein
MDPLIIEEVAADLIKMAIKLLGTDNSVRVLQAMLDATRASVDVGADAKFGAAPTDPAP